MTMWIKTFTDVGDDVDSVVNLVDGLVNDFLAEYKPDQVIDVKTQVSALATFSDSSVDEYTRYTVTVILNTPEEEE